MAKDHSSKSRLAPAGRERRVLLVVTRDALHPLDLPIGSTRLPSGAEIVFDGVRLELKASRSGVTVNDVEVSGPAFLHSGDLVAQGDVEYLVLPESAFSSERRSRLLEHIPWQVRVEEEVLAGRASFGLLLGRSGAFTPEFLLGVMNEAHRTTQVRTVVGTFGSGTVELLVLGEPAGLEAIRQLFSERAARDDETVRWGSSWFPTHGATAEELWSVAVDRLLGLETVEASTLVWMDPCMTRLRALAERWSGRHALALIGAEGVGRESLARAIRAVKEPTAPFIVHRASRFDPARWNEDLSRASGGSLHVRRPEMLPHEVLRTFLGAHAFHPSVGLSSQPPGLPPDRILIPDLAARPADIGAIAEQVLHSVDAQLGRRRSSLRAESRALLLELPAPENFRSLRNLVIRAALSSSGAEVRPEHFELGMAASSQRGVRAKVRETERQEIETALRRSGWNVTRAAEQMKLPRRTLVYRMARLGLRRPRGVR